MFTSFWSNLIAADRTNRRSHRRLTSRKNRLQSEHLEQRYLMTGENPVESSPVLDNEEALPEVAAASSSAADSADAPWQRFQSTEDFEAWLVEAAVAQYGHLFGQPSYGYRMAIWNDVVFSANALLSTTANDTTSFSSTNLQRAGVDEADIVETDGNYLYIVSGKDLVIVKAGIGDDLQVISRFHLQARPVGMYLSGDRLALVSTTAGHGNGQFSPIQWFGIGKSLPNGTTTVTILDIADRANPTQVQKAELDGALITSRVVDGQLRLVLNNQIQLPAPIIKPAESEVIVKPVEIPSNLVAIDSMWPWMAFESQGTYETQAEYLARVRDEIIDAIHPRIRSLSADGSVLSESDLLTATDLYYTESLLDRTVTSVVTFDLTSSESGPSDIASVISGAATQVYCTEDSVYVFAPQSSSANSDIWKFSIDGETHAVDLAAKGEIAGSLLNQFSADERDGYLRIVATSSIWNTGQSIFVLQQAGQELKVVGSISGIAANEELYSVRFMGNRAFFVTFRRVDPLFAVDLSEPTNPKILGELHLPGFSDYLQPIDENHILAIGRDADETTGQFEELQVSLFDVSDLRNPRLVHRYSFEGGRSTTTPATGESWQRGDGDHHSVTYLASEQILTIPVRSTYEWMSVEEPLFEIGEGGLQVFKIDVNSGFTPIGIIEHDTLVERSVRIDDRLFAISSTQVSVHELNDPSVELGRLTIGVEDVVEPIWFPPIVVQPIGFQPIRFQPIEIQPIEIQPIVVELIEPIADPLPIALPTSEENEPKTEPPTEPTSSIMKLSEGPSVEQSEPAVDELIGSAAEQGGAQQSALEKTVNDPLPNPSETSLEETPEQPAGPSEPSNELIMPSSTEVVDSTEQPIETLPEFPEQPASDLESESVMESHSDLAVSQTIVGPLEIRSIPDPIQRPLSANLAFVNATSMYVPDIDETSPLDASSSHDAIENASERKGRDMIHNQSAVSSSIALHQRIDLLMNHLGRKTRQPLHSRSDIILSVDPFEDNAAERALEGHINRK